MHHLRPGSIKGFPEGHGGIVGIGTSAYLQVHFNTVGTRFGAARKKLSDAGARISDEPMPLADEIATLVRWAQVAFAARCARRERCRS